MSVTITEKPYLIDFAGNLLTFKMTGTPVSVSGRKAVTQWKINMFPRLDYSFIIAYGEKQFVFTVKSVAASINRPDYIGNYRDLSLKEELVVKIAGNYEMGKDFQITISDSLEITFAALDFGGENVSLSSSDPQASFSRIRLTEGIARSFKNGYKIFAFLEITRYANGSVQQLKTPPMLLSLDNTNKAVLPLTLLRSYFSQVDIPVIDEAFRAYILQYAIIKYALSYSDYHDGKVQLVKRFGYRYVTAGQLGEQCKSLNIPDWITPVNGALKFSNDRHPLNYGCDSGLTVKSFRELGQFVYFMLFYGNGDGNYSQELQVRIEILNEDGTTVNDIDPGSVSMTNFNIIRIPLSFSSLSLSDYSDNILSYTVRVYPTDAEQRVWKRTFIMQEKPYHSHTFLLQNKYGVLESFFTDRESKEKTVEGEVVKKNGLNEIDITDTSITYIAQTGYKASHELKLLEEAVGNSFNFKIVNGKAIPITILPDTFTIFDETEELQNCQFQYMFNIATSDTGERTNTGTVITERESFEDVWMDERIDIDGNTTSVIWIDREEFRRVAATNSITEITSIK
ncbi:hypothetical protein LJC68_09425 [Bacteroidales bacterium OttesenSCG-928-B11]|nr:hypothetical protein [Bacteroidales bacterium OttesenSCG-928-C03]MDL2313082.1 hypothetical protein [Bacteroidales bacterium OttesenSCG-928-B11]